jgi:hypothetical protein
MSLALCILAFIVSAYAARKSLVGGIVVALVVGYFYGITRANLNEIMSHFIFDGAVIGLYVGRILAVPRPAMIVNTTLVRRWLLALIAWPVFLTLLPIQDPLIQVVGLRGNVFLLPMVILGVQMESDERHNLAFYIAILNIVVLAFALAEYSMGVESFYPRNEMTDLIFRSRVDDAARSYRIPATFTGSHAFAGTMVCSLPILVEFWASRTANRVKRYAAIAGLVAATLGVFMAASRTHAVVLFLLIIVGTLSFQMRPSVMGMWLSIIVFTGWLVFQDTRLQRFTSLQDTEVFTNRVAGSVNASFATALLDYPMGNGIGGGGTSIPYFLSERARNPLVIENEYARIQLELGLPGLLMWLAFIAWLLSFGLKRAMAQRNLGQRLAFVASAAYFATGMTGTGLLTSIPQSLLLMFFAGWIIRFEPQIVKAVDGPSAGLAPGPLQVEAFPK